MMAEELPTIADGHVWSEYIFDKWGQENWHSESVRFGNLIHVLPQIYETLELFGYHKLAKKLEKSVQGL